MTSPRTICETLEPRRLFTAIGITHRHVLHVFGSDQPNTITVGLSADGLTITANVSYPTARGVQQRSGTYPASEIDAVLIRGGPLADIITIDQTNRPFVLPVEIFAGGGDDSVYGGDEPDNIFGGAGNDYINAGNGINRVDGQSGNDTLTGGDNQNVLLGGPGGDMLIGGDNNDTIFGQGGDDTMIGNAGNDMLRGGNGIDSMNGGDGNDTLNNLTGRDTMMGGSGDNTFVVRSIRGNPTNDYVAQKDTLTRVPFPDDSGISVWDVLGALYGV